MAQLIRLFFLDRSLTFKITVTAFVPVLLMLLTSVFVGMASLENEVTTYFDNKELEIVELAAQGMVEAVASGDNTQISDTFLPLAQESDLLAAYVLDSKKSTYLIHTDSKQNGKEYSPKQSSVAEGHIISVPVGKEGEAIGYVVAVFSEERLHRFFARFREKQLLFAAVISVIGLLIYYQLVRMITSSIERIANQAESIGSGEPAAPVKYAGKDELGSFVLSFNRVANRLDDTLSSLRKERAGLQKTVAEQTGQLRASVQELEYANLRLEDALRARTKFFSSISHELRTPLNGILGTVSLLKEPLFGQLNDKQSEYVEQIEQSGSHLLSLVNDVLDIAKIEADSMTLEPSSFDLTECVESTLVMMHGLIKKQSLNLVFTPEGSFLMNCDYRRIRQVVFNLVANAAQFTDAGGSITVRLSEKDDDALVEITDTGIGLSEQQQQHLFKEFSQVKNVQNANRSGTGLGLVLSKRLVELHGGTMGVESRPGEGATFWFTLPISV